jgi:hypothetical protein
VSRFSIDSAPIPAFPTRTEEAIAAAEREVAKPGFFQVVGDAINSEMIIPWAIRQAQRSGFEYDPDFQLTVHDLQHLTSDLPEDMWGEFTYAVSSDHAMRIREQLLAIAESRRTLELAGWDSPLATLAIKAADPVVWIPLALCVAAFRHSRRNRRAERL